ncbi:MAG: Ig-like domain-containing protein [Myxococcota bacterium]|nr:Ig-like domain-containing protein [Myxococcota bacterium]
MKNSTLRGLFVSLSVAGLLACSGTTTERSTQRDNTNQTPMLSVQSIALRIQNQVLAIGSQTAVELFAKYENGDSRKIESGATWVSSSPGIATVDTAGVLTAVAQGQATISVTFQGQTSSLEITVTASQSPLVAILLSPDSGEVEAGKQLSFTAKGVYGDGMQYDITQSVIWSSSNTAVASVDMSGVVTGVAAGSVSIGASVSNVQGMTTLTVIPKKELVSIKISSPNTTVFLNESLQLSLIATYNDQSTRNVATEAQWSSDAPSVLSVDSSGKVSGLALGPAIVSATFEGQSATFSISVADGPTVTRLNVSPTNLNLSLGSGQQLTVTAMLSDGSSEDATGMATYQSSAPAIMTVSASGLVEAVAEGSAQITISYRSQSIVVNGTASACAYPSAGSQIQLSSVMPNVSWPNAHDEQGNQFAFSMQDFLCGAEYSQYTSIHFLVTAEWCPYCPDYLRSVNDQTSQIEAAGGKIVYVEVETNNRTPASSSQAHALINRYQINNPSLRVGDGDTQPTAMVFGNAVRAFPSMFVVRKSDMTVVANSTSQSHLSIAQQISGNGPMPNCSASDEESYEPNDSQMTAATITTGVSFDGGICTPSNLDWYLVDHAGRWTMDVTFTHATGDLDVYVFPEANFDPNNPSAAGESYDDNEQVSSTGRSFVVIAGYQGATTPYRLQLTATP